MRLDELERTHKGLLARARKLSTQLRQLSRSMQETHTWQSDVLLHMQQVFYDPAPAVPVTHDAPVQAGNGVSVFALVLGGSALAGVGYRLYVARKKRLPHAKAV